MSLLFPFSSFCFLEFWPALASVVLVSEVGVLDLFLSGSPFRLLDLLNDLVLARWGSNPELKSEPTLGL